MMQNHTSPTSLHQGLRFTLIWDVIEEGARPPVTVWRNAFFTEHADISKREVIVTIAERFGISASDVETSWQERRFSPTVDAFMEDGHKAGVRGVPAMAWPNRRAIVGLMPPTELVLRLRNEAPERLRE